MTFPAIFIGGPLHGMRVEEGPGGVCYCYATMEKCTYGWIDLVWYWYVVKRLAGDRRVWLYQHRTGRCAYLAKNRTP